MTTSDGPVTVLTTADPGLLAVAQSILEAAEIPFVVKGENQRILPPFDRAAEVQVGAADAEEARTLLAELA